MSSEWIKHDGSRQCPVEYEALVHVRGEHGGTVGDPRLARCIEWSPLVKEYTVHSGWSRPIEDIFAELPPEAEWIAANGMTEIWFASEPERNIESDWYSFKSGYGSVLLSATYYGDWRESKRKRPDNVPVSFEGWPMGDSPYLSGDAPDFTGDEFVPPEKSKPAPWFVVVGFPEGGGKFEYCETRKAADEIAIAEAKDGNEAFVCRAVASFTAKVERTTYENGGE